VADGTHKSQWQLLAHTDTQKTATPTSKAASFMLRITLVPGAHIYTCTGGREYINNPLEKYNNRKANTYLIPPSNLWWINNTEFGEVKLIERESEPS
jgi:hypothetical protein